MRRGEQEGQQPVAQQGRGEGVDQLGLQDLGRVEGAEPGRPGVLRRGVGQQAGLVGLAQRCRQGRGTAAQHPYRGEAGRVPGALGQRVVLAGREQRVRLGRAAHGLRGVVDEDVQRLALAPQLLAQAQHLARIAQVDGEDGQPVEPLLAARLGTEAAHRVVREARGDQQLRAVAQHHQRQLEPDLHPAAGEQHPASAQVGAQGASGGVVGGAGRAQAVVEGIDLSVGRLADVAGARLAEDPAGTGDGQRGVLAPAGRAGRGRCHHLGVGGRQFGTACPAPAQASVPREGRGDLLGVQAYRVVDGQRPQSGDRAMEGCQLLLAECVTHESPPVRCRAVGGPDRVRTGVSALTRRCACLCATDPPARARTTGFEPAYPPEQGGATASALRPAAHPDPIRAPYDRSHEFTTRPARKSDRSRPPPPPPCTRRTAPHSPASIRHRRFTRG